MLKHFGLAVLLASFAIAQTTGGPTAVKSHYKVGDTLHYVVTFDDDPTFTSVTLYFSTSATPPEQPGLSQNFSINQTQKLGPGKFEVEGKIPDSAVTGTYRLATVQPRIPPSGVKDYDATSFHESFDVENPAMYKFPPLKDVKPQ
jgi:hypothetical protein